MDHDHTLALFIEEYKALKEEQKSRIGFRDNLLYVTLTVFGGIFAFAVSNQSNYYSFLVIPWICVILGWTYLVNDEKITAIGSYIRQTLKPQIVQFLDTKEDAIFGWEKQHRSDRHRARRKLEQLIIDELTFTISGLVALIAFTTLVPNLSFAVWLLVGAEMLVLAILGIEIFVYAQLRRDW